MSNRLIVNPTEITIREYIKEYIKEDDLTKLDLTDVDGSDPLHVDEFFRTKAIMYQNNRLCSIWSVLYKDKLVGCFTLTMYSITNNKLEEAELVNKAPNLISYPAILLGQIGVDKQFRNKGMGHNIIQYITGLSRQIGRKIACRYIVLQTSKDKIKLYKKIEFKKSPKNPDNKTLLWMYKRSY